MAEPTGPTTLEDLLPGLGAAQTGGPQVWIGDYMEAPVSGFEAIGAKPPKTGTPYRPPTTGKVPVKLDIKSAEAAYYSLDPVKKKALIDISLKLGYINSPNSITDSALFAVWSRYVNSAAGYQSKGQNFTPWSIMLIDSIAQENAKKEGQMGKAPVTQTSTSTDLSSKLDARGILNTASRTLLGRDPTEEESNRFWQTLNAAERQNPKTTTTTTAYDAEGNIANQNSTTSGGLSGEGVNILAADEAKANPQYGAYQAATNYMNVLRNMVSGG